ncbi:MAG: succinate--CoA ligase subunit alpha [Candidatus Lernaella stagnicola]|nr:succinate--CoA ligase subunit alpha [Candidatus Lernaella stagnicola]
MSIFVNEKSKVVVQGITGKEGSFHARQCAAYGTKIVAGVTPGKGNQNVDYVPVFDTMTDAVDATKADVSLIFVPPVFAADAILEAADAGVGLCVVISDGIPTMDMIRVLQQTSCLPTRVVGPNCPGLISPGKCKVGIMPAQIHLPGKVGVISRSGTLTYEVVSQLTALGIGQSTCIGIGGDQVVGTDFIDCLEAFERDPETEVILMIGEIGGDAEERAARYIADNVKKPVVSFVAGLSAPPGKRMGHAGAIIAGGKGTARAKLDALAEGGVHVVEDASEIGATVEEMLADAD